MTMTTLIGALDSIAVVLGGLTALIGTVGGLIWQDRRPNQGDQGRAYRTVHRTAQRAAKRRAQYDAAVVELDRARSVAEALDTEVDVDDDDEYEDPFLAEQRLLAERIAADRLRMESAVATFGELVIKSGAQLGRAVQQVTDQQSAVQRQPTRSPEPEPEQPAPEPPRASTDPRTGSLPTFEALRQQLPSAYRTPRDRAREQAHDARWDDDQNG